MTLSVLALVLSQLMMEWKKNSPASTVTIQGPGEISVSLLAFELALMIEKSSHRVMGDTMLVRTRSLTMQWNKIICAHLALPTSR
jgi:hypothetical protein